MIVGNDLSVVGGLSMASGPEAQDAGAPVHRAVAVDRAAHGRRRLAARRGVLGPAWLRPLSRHPELWAEEGRTLLSVLSILRLLASLNYTLQTPRTR